MILIVFVFMKTKVSSDFCVSIQQRLGYFDDFCIPIVNCTCGLCVMRKLCIQIFMGAFDQNVIYLELCNGALMELSGIWFVITLSVMNNSKI